MSNTTLKENVRKKWQKGVALLFALGILGLLLVMALGFATNSIFDQLIATNNSNNASARVIANSGLERVRMMLQNHADKMAHLTAAAFDFKSWGILGYSNSSIYPPTPPAAPIAVSAVAKSDMLSNASFFGAYTTWNVNMDANINWIYLKSDNRLIGRMAYIILNRADLDPTKLVKPDVDETLATEPRVGADANEINLTPVISFLPAGLLAAMAPTPAITVADIVRRCNYSYESHTTQPNPGVFDEKWLDYQFMFRKIYDGDPNPLVIPALPPLAQFNPALTGANSMASYFQQWFIYNSKNSQEAFWLDKNIDGKITMTRDPATGEVYSEELLHRFNLARIWNTDFPNTAALYSTLLLSTAATGGIPNVNIFQKPSAGGDLWTDDKFDGYGIPWLATFGMKNSGTTVQIPAVTGPIYPIWVDDDATFKETFDFVKDRRHQIAANLVDYCKPDTAAVTSDVTPANWGATSPTFTGNKKTPYINELGIQIKATAIRSDLGASDSQVSVTVDVEAAPELIDIYGLAAYTNSTITIYYDLYYTFAGSSVGPPATVDLHDQVGTVPILSTDWPGVGAKYAIPVGGVNIYTSTSTYTILQTDPVNIDINNLVLTVKKIILTYDGRNVDCSNIVTANPNTGSSTTWGLKQQLTYLASVKGTVACDSFMGFQTNDPRQNLNPGDWTKRETAIVLAAGASRPFNDYNTTTTVGTLGAINTAVNPIAGTDTETVAEPAYNSTAGTRLSTAFIREAPIVSPWELGFIHRGKAWETLNLHRYDENKKALAIAVDNGSGVYNIFSAGGGLYAAGDANILDQIKMNSYPKNYKVDISNQYKTAGGRYAVIDALFTNILSGSSLTATAPGITGGAAISAADISSISGAIAPHIDYLTRAQLINDIAAVDPVLSYTTKALKDEIIGKSVNLIDFDSYYTVILIAQTIKDVGTAGGIDIIKKDSNGTYNFTGANQAKLGVFDCLDTGFTNAKGEKIYAYADEITSTLKVQALIHKKIDGSCEILSVKYIQ